MDEDFRKLKRKIGIPDNWKDIVQEKDEEWKGKTIESIQKQPGKPPHKGIQYLFFNKVSNSYFLIPKHKITKNLRAHQWSPPGKKIITDCDLFLEPQTEPDISSFEPIMEHGEMDPTDENKNPETQEISSADIVDVDGIECQVE